MTTVVAILCHPFHVVATVAVHFSPPTFACFPHHCYTHHTNCTDLSVTVVNCTHGDIRLAGGGDPRKGRVEICIHNVWGTICSDGWSSADANVVCSQLGYYPSGMFIFYLLLRNYNP